MNQNVNVTTFLSYFFLTKLKYRSVPLIKNLNYHNNTIYLLSTVLNTFSYFFTVNYFKFSTLTTYFLV